MRSLTLVFEGDVGGNATEKSDQSGSARVAEVSVGVENVFEALQQRIVVEGRVGHGARPEERRQKHRACTVASIALKPECHTRSNGSGLRNAARLGPGCSLQQNCPGALTRIPDPFGLAPTERSPS